LSRKETINNTKVIIFGQIFKAFKKAQEIIAYKVDKRPSLVFKTLALFTLVFASQPLFAQSESSSNMMMYGLVVIGVILLIAVLIQGTGTMVQIEAQKSNVKGTRSGLKSNFAMRGLPKHLRDKEVHILKRGYDISLEGEASGDISPASQVTRFAVQPTNWRGIAPIPKLHVAVGDTVLAGQPLFFDKPNPEVEFVAPVSGEVIEVNRGAKRAISEIVILADKEMKYVDFDAPKLEDASREDIVAFMMKSGAWTLLRQRPFDVIPANDAVPANIFISTFDSAPLAPDLNLVVAGREDDFQKGLDVLGVLTSGSVHLGLDGRSEHMPASVYTNAEGVKTHWFRGPHPSGNVGVQMHHVAPISAAKTAWVMGVQEVITLGALFGKGKYDATRVIAVTGDPIEKNGYLKTFAGAHIGELLEGNTVAENSRIINGDVLSGKTGSLNGYVNMFDDQLTVLEEGNYFEMFGWMVPQKSRPTVSKTFFNLMTSGMKYVPDTNMHGEKRAFVMTGEYEKLLPMDVFPQHLFKAILASDFERMEGLGIYELSEEDVALCEFACTSKMPLQGILRDGLDLMREQG
jgi:Na+-transporting NADH:ubiquinone oxidoreductase subunit A